ncbi:ABC transporter, ATP-binding protein [Leptotrichia sp. oral taxon 215 str. W9775]|uniref:energy-coupling factor ABC transporter ATP-binding protein n=1 Tax=Leptotrichia sp. oral taxon 215 TaxID=712359 RepID=UPI0003ADB2B7|nr:ABC transporter ATP-binding protein [Leptotrichia sp. oral taxon 215]ERK69106.1 ABC transporter, ATP-binding protein [Leptotrichia sp. oral taxon 215 str. W9775]
MCYFKLEDVSYKYPLEDREILKNINLDIKKGEFWAVIGKNGSGKTTLCNVLRRFIPDFYKGELKGKITLEGKELKDYSAKEIVQKVGFVFQNPFTQISGVKETVFEEIAFGLENLALDAEYIRKRVEETLKLLHIEELKDKNPYELSGGQGQKVALASIIAMDPEIMVIDEPTSQLDPKGTEEIFEIIDILKKEGKTIILVEHKLELIAEYAEKVMVLDEGEMILSGNTEDVLKNKILLEKEIGIPQYAALAYRLMDEGKVQFEEIPITKEKAVEVFAHKNFLAEDSKIEENTCQEEEK